MIDPRSATPLPRPAPAAEPGRLDEPFYDLVETRFVRLVQDNPVLATALGLHEDDDLLGDGSRDAVLAELEADRAHLAAVEAIDPAELSDAATFERDLELHNVRRSIFDVDVLRLWERRSFALDTVGDGLFLLFARDHAPLARAARRDRRPARGRSPTYLEEAKTRATVPQVRRWQRIEIETAARAADVLRRARRRRHGRRSPAAEQRRLERASESAKLAVELYAAWLEGTLDGGTDDWAIGRERHDALVALARVRRPRRRRDPGARLGAAARGARARARRPPARSTRTADEIDGHRPGQVGPAADLRRRPRRLPRRDAPARAGTSSSTTS